MYRFFKDLFSGEVPRTCFAWLKEPFCLLAFYEPFGWENSVAVVPGVSPKVRFEDACGETRKRDLRAQAKRCASKSQFPSSWS